MPQHHAWRIRLTACVAASCCFAAAPPIHGQDHPTPTLASLEARHAERPDDPEASFQLAVELMRGKLTMDMSLAERQRITRLFDTALRGDHRDARYHIRYAQWLTALDNRIEAQRFVSRGLERLGQSGITGALADTLFIAAQLVQLAMLAPEVDDNRHLVHGAFLPVATTDCPGDLFCTAYTQPQQFNKVLRDASRLGQLVAARRGDLMQRYERVFAIDASRDDLFRGLVSERFAMEEWDDAARAARMRLAAAGDAAWAYLVLGAALWRMDRRDAAAGALELGYSLLPDSVQRAWRDPAVVATVELAARLDEVDDETRATFAHTYWLLTDPRLLAPINERWLEHLAREVYAEYRFGSPEIRLAGRDSERGKIYLRLGPPRHIFYVTRDPSRETTRREMEVAAAMLACGGAAGCIRALERQVMTSTTAHGRWIFWLYSDDQPPFILEAPLRGRNPRHKIETYSHILAEHVEKNVGSAYAPPFDVVELPVQTARFRGREPGTTELLLALEPQAEVDRWTVTRTGLFGIDALRGQIAVENVVDGPPRAIYAIQIAREDRLRFRLELETAQRVAPGDPDSGRPGVARWQAAVPTEPLAGGFAISDLLLTRRVSTSSGTPASWRDLRFDAAPKLTFAPGDSIGVIFELYDLGEGTDGAVTYTVRVELIDERGRSLAARAFEALGRLLGETRTRADGVLTWQRTALPVDGRTLEYFVLLPDPAAEGARELRISVMDVNRGVELRASRRVEFVSQR